MTEKEKQERFKDILANRTQSDELVKQLLEVQAGTRTTVTIETLDGRTYVTKAVPLRRVGTNLVEVPAKPAAK